MNLYPHQKKFLTQNPDRVLLCWEVGSGKTLAATEWMKLRPHISFLIVVPKQIKKMWQEVAPPHAVVVTKEEFKKYKEPFEGIVVDEADFFGSPLFTKGRSQLATTLYNWIRSHPTAPVLLASGTVIRNAPHTSHTILSYIQKAPDWKVYRGIQYQLVSRPYNPRPFFLPRKGWQKYSAKMIRENADIVSLTDIATIPEQHEDVVRLPRSPSRLIHASWHDQARAESGEAKLKWIKEYAKDKRKVVIVSRYLSTIEAYAKELSKERETFILTGSTKDQEQTIKDARESFECYLLIQADLAAGFELPEFAYMVFVSLSFSVRSLTQMKGRTNRINALKSNYFVYLLGGKCDESVYKRVVESGLDFVL